mgnify:CR=1 FL=1
MAKQMAFYVDLRSCVGCKACQIACKDKNDLGPDRVYRRVVEVAGGDWIQQGDAWTTNAFAYYLPTACMHCEEAPCVKACPTTAMYKRDDGVVLVDQTKCIGCRYCEWACPYGAPQYNAAIGKMTKCDFCVDYLDQNQPPACVAACGMRVLDYGELADLQAKYGTTNDIYPLPDPAIAKPALVITPHGSSLRVSTEPVRIANPEEI